MKLMVPPLKIPDEAGFLPEIDIFNRKVFGESLLNLIKNTDDEIVLALDAPWGEGKSTFIKMWRGYLGHEGVPNIYFDAFENDYQQDPFLAISSQIYNLIDKEDGSKHKEFTKKATSALKIVGRAGLRIGIKALTAGVLDDTVLEGTGDVLKETSGLVDNFVSNQLTKAEQNRKCLDAFKEHLSELAGELGGDTPVIFIIDELDRCKPKFALSLIESIKHLFSVPNITFVLVINRNQLKESVRCEYGSGVDAGKYLQKFVSIWTTLPKSKEIYSSVPKTYLHNCLSRMDYVSQNRSQQINIVSFEELTIYYNLSLREIEKSLTNFAIIHNATDGKLDADYSLLSIFISIIKVIKMDVYNKLSAGSVTYDELLENADLTNFKFDYWNDMPEGHPVCWLLKYFLSTAEEAKSLLGQGNYLNNRHGFNRDAIKNICGWLETFRRE